jgi:hypothetical protein
MFDARPEWTFWVTWCASIVIPLIVMAITVTIYRRNVRRDRIRYMNEIDLKLIEKLAEYITETTFVHETLTKQAIGITTDSITGYKDIEETLAVNNLHNRVREASDKAAKVYPSILYYASISTITINRHSLKSYNDAFLSLNKVIDDLLRISDRNERFDTAIKDHYERVASLIVRRVVFDSLVERHIPSKL